MKADPQIDRLLQYWCAYIKHGAHDKHLGDCALSRIGEAHTPVWQSKPLYQPDIKPIGDSVNRILMRHINTDQLCRLLAIYLRGHKTLTEIAAEQRCTVGSLYHARNHAYRILKLYWM